LVSRIIFTRSVECRSFGFSWRCFHPPTLDLKCQS
jgi:hypothetical protein